MSGYYSFSVRDGSLKKEIASTQFNFTHKGVLDRNVNNADSIVTVDISEFTTVTAVMVLSSLPITLTVNGVAIAVTNFLFMEVSALTSLTVACTDTTGSEVEIVVWGT